MRDILTKEVIVKDKHDKTIYSSPSTYRKNQVKSHKQLQDFEILESNTFKTVETTPGFIVEHYNPATGSSASHMPPIMRPEEYRLEYKDPDAEETGIYRKYFFGKAHQNFVGKHPKNGYICISIRKEIDTAKKQSALAKIDSFLYRVILRTEESFSYIIKPEARIKLGDKSVSKKNMRDIIPLIFPDLQTIKFKEIEESSFISDLMDLEHKLLQVNYKFGILYCKDGQTNEDDMFANEKSSALFDKFLNTIGEKIKLEGYQGFRGGLDVKDNTTGLESIVSHYKENNIMFHVSTLLPYSNNDPQQIKRKSHIGNDICIIIFKENTGSNIPFNPSSIISQFPHVFIVVETIPGLLNSDPLKVRISCCRRTDVPTFGPYPVEKGIFEVNENLKYFLLAKLINGENASYKGNKFSTLRLRTRKRLFIDLIKPYMGEKLSLLTTSINMLSGLLTPRAPGGSFKLFKGISQPLGPPRPYSADARKKGGSLYEISDVGQKNTSPRENANSTLKPPNSQSESALNEQSNEVNSKKRHSVKDNKLLTRQGSISVTSLKEPTLDDSVATFNQLSVNGLLAKRKSVTLLPDGQLVISNLKKEDSKNSVKSSASDADNKETESTLNLIAARGLLVTRKSLTILPDGQLSIVNNSANNSFQEQKYNQMIKASINNSHNEKGYLASVGSSNQISSLSKSEKPNSPLGKNFSNQSNNSLFNEANPPSPDIQEASDSKSTTMKNAKESIDSLNYNPNISTMKTYIEELKQALATVEQEKNEEIKTRRIVEEELASLKRKFQEGVTEDMKVMFIENSYLKLEVELKETKSKLNRAKNFISNMQRAAEELIDTE